MTNVDTINPKTLPSLPLEDRRQLPNCAAIYFVLDSDDVALYIGQSIALSRRWMAHHRAKQLQGLEGIRIAWLEVSDTALLDDIEQACIDHFAPSLNGVARPIGCRNIKEGERWRQVRLPDEASARLDAWAAKKELSTSYLIRRLILEALEQGRDEKGDVP